jgi:formylmethanofuran dehydrogenase subunit B
VNGIDAAGTAYRMDGIPIMTRKFMETGYPTDTELMQEIYDRIRKVKDNA